MRTPHPADMPSLTGRNPQVDHDQRSLLDDTSDTATWLAESAQDTILDAVIPALSDYMTSMADQHADAKFLRNMKELVMRLREGIAEADAKTLKAAHDAAEEARAEAAVERRVA